MPSPNNGNVLGTGVDEILRELDDAGKASVSSLASETGFEKEKVKEWGKALEKSGLVKVKYSGIKGMVLVYDSDKDYKQVSEEEDLDLDESDLEDENNGGEESGIEDGEKDDLEEVEQGSVAETVHREDLDVESDEDEEDDEDDRQKVDLDGGKAELDVSGSAGGVKDDVVEGSEVSDSNVVEINESEIDEFNLGTSSEEDEEEMVEPKESSEEYLEEDLERLEKIEEKAEDKNREDEEVVLGDDIEEDESEEEIVDSEELSEEEVILPNSEETESNDFTEDVEKILEKIKTLNNSVGDVEEDQDVYNELEVELNILKDLIEDEELSDELNEEVVDCIDEAEANLQKVKDDEGIISRVKSMLGFGKEDEEEDLESFESTEVDTMGENDLEFSNKDLNEDSSQDKFIGKDISSQEGFSLDEESFDEIENVVKDKSTDSVDYKPGENLEEVLNSIDKITGSIAAGKEVDGSFNKVGEELNKMKEIIKDRDLDNSEEENVIVTINSLEDALETNKSSLLQRFKSKIGGVFR